MTYVDGFVAAVPTTNREIYKKHAEAAAVVFKEHGALKFVECWGDDVPEGKVTRFPWPSSAPQGQGSRTKYSRSWSGSGERIAIKGGASARRALGHRQRLRGLAA
ncbi:MAG TPA: DUF1428 domain-containing protein [Xanthobacteraceae bacterium]|nr:DUF1428 domain-containing protein [Xanthobacteraceae bacterium]